MEKNGRNQRIFFKRILLTLLVSNFILFPGWQGLFANDGPKLDLVYKETSLKEILEIFSKQSGYNIFIDPQVKDEKITVFAQDLTFFEAINYILKTNKLGYKMIGDKNLMIYPEADSTSYLNDATVRVYTLKYIEPSVVADVLQTIKGIEARSVISDQHRTVVCTGRRDLLKMADEVVAKLDTRTDQIYLDVKLVEIDKTHLKSLGIEPEKNSYNGSEIAKFNSRSIPALLNLLNVEGATKVLAHPQIKVVNSKKAKVHIGDRIPIEISKSEKTANGQIQLSNEVQFIEVGISLEIEVLNVHEHKECTISLNSGVSSVVSFTKQGFPQVRTRKADTVIRIKDGEMTVLGGLINREERRDHKVFPIIDQIPIFGDLINKRGREVKDSEIMIFVSLRIQKQDGEENPKIGSDLQKESPILTQIIKEYGEKETGPAPEIEKTQPLVRGIENQVQTIKPAFPEPMKPMMVLPNYQPPVQANQENRGFGTNTSPQVIKRSIRKEGKSENHTERLQRTLRSIKNSRGQRGTPKVLDLTEIPNPEEVKDQIIQISEELIKASQIPQAKPTIKSQIIQNLEDFEKKETRVVEKGVTQVTKEIEPINFDSQKGNPEDNSIFEVIPSDPDERAVKTNGKEGEMFSFILFPKPSGELKRTPDTDIIYFPNVKNILPSTPVWLKSPKISQKGNLIGSYFFFLFPEAATHHRLGIVKNEAKIRILENLKNGWVRVELGDA